ncbi:P1 family peptidase [Actinomadura sp. ATCC 31491]|uniref:P1 family peptidase n=1 Tax=Actinomadura luzonensis TaxID=2805427 RepID=A0ABT0G4P3_9ACTN|nr:P1 family peptidase [Actinomadura luzonensis]MCK2219103.1 P1 family peptidase [Actinomadura luzonensis]
MRPGATNSLADVAGLRVGHAHRVGGGWRTGTTVVLAPPGGAVAGVDVRGAAPGTRETELLDPRNLVERVHAVVLSGGSAYGLSAACGVMDRLAEAGVGFPVEGGVVPIVPAAVIFDLGRGGAFRATPDATFGAAAHAFGAPAPPSPQLSRGTETHVGGRAAAPPHPGRPPFATAPPHASGSIGAGTGAVAGGLAGGVGTASVVLPGAVLPGGATVAALAVANPAGSVLDPHDATLAGARYGLPGEFAHLRPPSRAEAEAWRPPARPAFNTTIGVVATDRTLTKAQCGKLAAVAHDGLARAIRPAHTMTDGDTIFALATCAGPAPGRGEFQEILAAAADAFARAVAHAVLAATGREDAPAYLDVFPSATTGGIS